jgi:hypothetical protein
MDEICQDDQWFEQAFTYMNKNDIPLPNDKKLHVKFWPLIPIVANTNYLTSLVLWSIQASNNR